MIGNKYDRINIPTSRIDSQSVRYNDILTDWLTPNKQGDTKVIIESKMICKRLSLNDTYTRYYLDEWAIDVFYYEVFLNYDSTKSSFNTFFNKVVKNKIFSAIEYYNAKGRRQLLIDSISIDTPLQDDTRQTIADTIPDIQDIETDCINNMCDDTSNTYKRLIQSLTDNARTILTLKFDNGLKKANIIYLMGITEKEYDRCRQEIKRKTLRYY